MLKVMKAVLDAIFELAGLLVFLVMAFAFGHPDNAAWDRAFIFGAAVSLLVILIKFRRIAEINGLLLGANGWLILGGIATLLHIKLILDWYASERESSIFGVIFVTGIILTFASSSGFVGIKDNAKKAFQASLIMLLLTAGCVLVSAHFRGNLRYGALIPMAMLIWSSRILRRRT